MGTLLPDGLVVPGHSTTGGVGLDPVCRHIAHHHPYRRDGALTVRVWTGVPSRCWPSFTVGPGKLTVFPWESVSVIAALTCPVARLSGRIDGGEAHADRFGVQLGIVHVAPELRFAMAFRMLPDRSSTSMMSAAGPRCRSGRPGTTMSVDRSRGCRVGHRLGAGDGPALTIAPEPARRKAPVHTEPRESLRVNSASTSLSLSQGPRSGIILVKGGLLTWTLQEGARRKGAKYGGEGAKTWEVDFSQRRAPAAPRRSSAS